MTFRLFAFLFFNFPITVLGAVDFTCPSSTIRGKGVFPRGASGVNTFPKSYSCTIQFDIADGYIVVFEASAVNEQYGEHFKITDTLNNVHEITSYSQTVYAPASGAKIEIVNDNGFPAYFVKWEYVHIASYKTVKEKEGVPVSLAIPAKQGLVFSAAEGMVLATSGEKRNIQVYNGNGLKGRYLGELSGLTENGMLKAEGSSLTLTTFGNEDTSGNGYVIGVSATSLQQYNSYRLVNLDETPYADLSGSSAVTFFTSRKDYFDIVSLTADGNTVVKVQPLAPGQGRSALLTYEGQNFDNFMPQEIMGLLFTVSASGSSASISFKDDTPSWNVAYHGRKGKIISANAWTPGANPSTNRYIHTYDDQELMTFHFNVDEISINHSGDQLNVTMGRNGSISQYSVSESNSPVKTYNGTFIEATFNAKSTDSMFILNFETESPFPVSTTLKPTTTTQGSTVTSSRPNSQSSVKSETATVRRVTENPLGTTTKVTSRGSGLFPLLISFSCLFNLN